jgi:hypothetical protein
MTRLARFVLVDLYDQAAFIPRDIRTPPERFLAWLRRFGEAEGRLVFKKGRYMEAYAFRSMTSLESSFRYDDEGELHVGRDADVIRRVFPRVGLPLRGDFRTMRKPVGSEGAR